VDSHEFDKYCGSVSAQLIRLGSVMAIFTQLHVGDDLKLFKRSKNSKNLHQHTRRQLQWPHRQSKCSGHAQSVGSKYMKYILYGGLDDLMSIQNKQQ